MLTKTFVKLIEKGFKTKTAGVIIVQWSLEHLLTIFSLSNEAKMMRGPLKIKQKLEALSLCRSPYILLWGNLIQNLP